MAVQEYESVIGFNIGGNYAAVVHHWKTDEDGDQTAFESARDLAEALETDDTPGDTLFDMIQAIMAEDCFISSIRTRRLSNGGGATYAKLFASGDYPGLVVGNSDAAQVAGCMLKFTSTNPKLDGRTFWPGVCEASLVDGRFILTYENAMLALGARYLDDFTNSSVYYAVLKHGSPASYTRIVAYELSPTPGTIRRRLVPV